MGNIVFILGAGASHEDGAPLMKDFMGVASSIYNDPADKIIARNYIEDFKRALDFHKALEVAKAKYGGDLRNIEAVLGMLEGCIITQDITLLDWAPVSNDVTLKQILESFRILIVKTLEERIKFPLNDDGYVCATPTYYNFAGLIKNLVDKNHNVSIITTNYDVMLDVALWDIDQSFSDTFSNYTGREHSETVMLYKLHGSTNWYKSEESLKGIPVSRLGNCQYHIGGGGQRVPVEFSKFFPSNEHAHIAPPLPNKSGYLALLSGIWGAAMQKLRQANVVMVCGYSLPESDYLFRYVNTLGMVGNDILQNIYVCDPDEQVGKRFSGILSDDLRGLYAYKAWRFSEAIPQMNNILPSSGF